MLKDTFPPTETKQQKLLGEAADLNPFVSLILIFLPIVSTGPTPEWDEAFAWAFESPPKGQKLHISCKNKSKIGKSSFGKVTIQIDRVVMLGSVAGEYTLLPVSKSGPPRNLEIEFQWSNK
ncbi:hypothetical protein HPP92_012663 [Vanilla planifolia]|uniref:C2 domain-containing protein n=1 Tax=Vanilla planifolia TaxID=51239 RepID=A0A835QXA0_VANPL|nr:hypothetical protein HPP92_012663 [Vanilla planifolia]